MSKTKSKSKRQKKAAPPKPTTTINKSVTINKTRRGGAVGGQGISIFKLIKWLMIIAMITIVVMIPLSILKSCNSDVEVSKHTSGGSLTNIKVPWKGLFDAKWGIFQSTKRVIIDNSKNGKPGPEKEDPNGEVKPDKPGQETKPDNNGNKPDPDIKPEDEINPTPPDSRAELCVRFYYSGEDIEDVIIYVKKGEAIGNKMPAAPKDRDGDAVYCYYTFDHWYPIINGNINRDEAITAETILSQFDIEAHPAFNAGPSHLHSQYLVTAFDENGDEVRTYKCENCTHTNAVTFHSYVLTGTDNDDAGHKCYINECENCGDEVEITAHTYNDLGFCTICAIKRGCEHEFDEYDYCVKCGEYDQKMKSAIDDGNDGSNGDNLGDNSDSGDDNGEDKKPSSGDSGSDNGTGDNESGGDKNNDANNPGNNDNSNKDDNGNENGNQGNEFGDDKGDNNTGDGSTGNVGIDDSGNSTGNENDKHGDNSDNNSGDNGDDNNNNGENNGEKDNPRNQSDNAALISWEANALVIDPDMFDLDYKIDDVFPPAILENENGERFPNVSVCFESAALAHAFNVTVEISKTRPNGNPYYDYEDSLIYYIIIEGKGLLPLDCLGFSSRLLMKFSSDGLTAVYGVNEYKTNEQQICLYVEIRSSGGHSSSIIEKIMENSYIAIMARSDVVGALNNFKSNIKIHGSTDSLIVARIVDVAVIDGEYYWQLYVHTDYRHEMGEVSVVDDSCSKPLKRGVVSKYGGTYYLKDLNANYSVEISHGGGQDFYSGENTVDVFLTGDLNLESWDKCLQLRENELIKYDFYYTIYKDDETGNIIFDYYCTSHRVVSAVCAVYVGLQGETISKIEPINYVTFSYVGVIEVDSSNITHLVVRILA